MASSFCQFWPNESLTLNYVLPRDLLFYVSSRSAAIVGSKGDLVYPSVMAPLLTTRLTGGQSEWPWGLLLDSPLGIVRFCAFDINDLNFALANVRSVS